MTDRGKQGRAQRIRPVHVGACVLGEGLPKICVPVMGASIAAMEAAAQQAAAAGADLIELRIDSLSAMPTLKQAEAACRAVRRASGLPVLFTLRTQRDGGPGSADAPAYEALLTQIAGTGACDALDCELSIGEEAFARIAQAAHEAGVPVVGSSHEFGGIGDVQRITQWFARQQALGADVCKAAVMAHSARQSLEAALAMVTAGETLSVPYIAIIMGRCGVFTRTACGMMGSCLTFGMVGQESAPGQMEAGILRGIILEMERAQNGKEGC